MTIRLLRRPTRSVVGAVIALTVGLVAVGAVLVVRGENSDADAGPDAARMGGIAQPEPNVNGFDGNASREEALLAHAVAWQDSRVLGAFVGATNVELLSASHYPADPKSEVCLDEMSCVERIYYAWDLGRSVAVVVNVQGSSLAWEPQVVTGVHLTARLKASAVEIAASDPAIATAVGSNPMIGNVADNECGTELCAAIALRVAPDGDLHGKSEWVTLQVSLTRRQVTWASAQDVGFIVDRRGR